MDMIKQNHTFFFAVFFLFLTGACSKKEKPVLSASVMGEIVNPQSSSVVLLRNNKMIDSVLLDRENRFYYTFDSLRPGLYTFRHNYASHYESQMFFIEQGDSIQLRLNTRDFDESLMYSGAAAAKNNFLMKLFYENRNSYRTSLKYYKIEAEKFSEKMDSVRLAQENELTRLYKNKVVSTAFKEVAQSIIDYAYYGMHERYAFLINRYGSGQNTGEIPSRFFDYRKTVDLNQKELQTYYIYQYFLDDFIKNKYIENCLSENEIGYCLNLNAPQSLREQMLISDSIFKLSSLRSLFITRYAARLIVLSEEDRQVDSTLSFLQTLNDYSQEDLQKVQELAAVQKRQFIGNIGSLSIRSAGGADPKIKELLHRPTVFFYWSLYFRSHHINQHRRIEELKALFPSINFIGINIDNDNRQEWLSSLKNFGYTTENEYQLQCPNNQRGIYRNYLNKLVLVNANGKIIKGNLELFNPNVRKELAAFSR